MEAKAQRILNIYETGVSETELDTAFKTRVDTIEAKADASTGGYLGSIKPTDSAPTPARNGNYTFSIGGNKPAWLTAEAGITTVKAGDGVAVVYTEPSSYTYTHVDVDSDISSLSNDISSLKEFVVNGGNITATDETLLTADQSNYGFELANTFSTSGNQWFSEQNKVNVATNLVSVKTKVSSIGNVIVYDFDPIAKTVTAIGTFTAVATGWQSFTLPSPVAIASGHYVGTSNTAYQVGGAGAQKLVSSGGVVSSFVTDGIELCQTIAIEIAIPIKGNIILSSDISSLSSDISSLSSDISSFSNDISSFSNDISSLKEFVVNGGNITATDETLLTADQSNYGFELANTFSTSGNQEIWFSEQNKVMTATTLVSVKTKVNAIGAVIVYDFNPVAKTVTTIGTFSATVTGLQTFILPSPVTISAGHYIGTSNTHYKIGGAGAQKLVVSGGVVSTFASDNVELCQTIGYQTTVNEKGITELNNDIVDLTEKVDNILVENENIRLFNDSFTTQDSTNWGFVGAWTTETNGIKPAAIGNTTYLLSKRVYHSDKRFMRMRILMGVNTKFMIPIVWGGTINDGEGASCFSIDFSGKKLIIYSVGADNQATASGYTTTELNTTIIPDNLIGAREYIIELHKNGTNHILRLFDTLTGEKVEVSHNGWAAGRQNQYYGFYVDSGALPTIMKFEVWSLNRPDVVFAGDSITEGVMVIDRTRRYAEQFRTNNINKRVVISARGGDTIDGILAKFATEYNIYKPKKLSVLIGANGGNTLTKLQQLKSNCDAINCTLILNYRTCQYATNAHIEGNTLIAQIGVNGARFDIATALNNNPIGATDGTDSRYNPALFYDSGLHPNNDGDDKMYNRLLIDVPELYYS